MGLSMILNFELLLMCSVECECETVIYKALRHKKVLYECMYERVNDV